LETIFDVALLTQTIQQKEAEINEPSFWDENEQAQSIFSTLSQLKKSLDTYNAVKQLGEDCEVYLAMIEEEGETDSLMAELTTTVKQLSSQLEELEIKAHLSGKYDTYNAFFSINAGAGGTDAQDWAQMLLRMYVRWFEKRGFKADVISQTMGDEAGIKQALIKVEGEFCYGYLKNENGVHRLVRLSPFNANSKRQTSFASVDVVPIIEQDNTDLDIDTKDLKIDTYRASGAGGQHVNKTDSAVRITHLPTGIVATSQNSRSQGANKETALSILKSRIAKLLDDEHKEFVEDLRGVVKEIAWGHQIRSYVFHPYKLVKDLRTHVETSNLQAVMDGDLDAFVNAQLKAK